MEETVLSAMFIFVKNQVAVLAWFLLMVLYSILFVYMSVCVPGLCSFITMTP